MNLEFKFNCEQNSTIVEIPPNLLFAYKESVSEKINSIIVYFVLFCCASFMCVNSLAQFIPFLCVGRDWFLIFAILSCFCLIFWAKWIFDDTPRSLKIFCIIMISNFEKYIDNIINSLDIKLSHSNRSLGKTSAFHAYKIEKTIVTAQRLKELRFGCLDGGDDLRGNIKFIKDNIDGLYGLKIKKVKYEKKQKNQKRYNRSSTIHIC